MTAKRPTQRDPKKVAFSVALPRALVAELEHLAKSETRSRNGQIERFLAEAVAKYHAEKGRPELYPLPEPDLDKDIAPEPPPPPFGQSQSQSKSESQNDDDLPPLPAPKAPKKRR
ncbi:hypothetical protein IMCC26134_15175 [Verrucomicrobia bacterium IMCC26134]|nr:hypothetical protein IMCC26134_15175 [Verrucomicrobia bacterium IMCC26134]